MYKHRFFNYQGKWRYSEKGSETSNFITTAILEEILGVVGGPEVIVVATQPNGDRYHITILNGFIDKVEHVFEENDYYDKENETGAYIATRYVPKTEFCIKNKV